MLIGSLWKHIMMYIGWIVLMIILNNGRGIQGWTYHYHKEKMEWELARQLCKQHYTDMVAIQNMEEIDYLNQQLSKHDSHYWIGLRKIAGQWTWVGTMKPLAPEANNWATREPNNQGAKEDCVEMYLNRVKDTGKWNDDKCSKKKAVLCYTASCLESSCSLNAECVENIGSYMCKCHPGFTGSRCHEAVGCGTLKNPEQGFVQCNHVHGDFRFNSTCHFDCDLGYILHGTKQLHCLSSGTWDSGPPKCQAVQCPPIATTTDGWNLTCSHPVRTSSYNSTCVFSCEEGFELRGSHTTRCDHTGKWTHNTPNCTAVTCDPLVISENGRMTCTDPLGNSSFRSKCAVTCEEGYVLRGEKTLTCMKTGNWSAETPTCEAVTCDSLVIPDKGHMTCTDPLGNSSFRSLCAVTCGEGYVLRGEKTLTCMKTGNWSAETPTCEAVTCDPVVIPENGHMACTDPLGKSCFRSVCAVTCNEGYILRGEKTLTCMKTGNWSAETPICEAVTCDPLVMPENGHMTCTDPLGKSYFHSTCAVTCKEGYTLRGAKTLTCMKTGNWSAETPTCEAVTCDPLGMPEDGHMACTDPLGKSSFRSVCAVTCGEGYVLRGEKTLACMKTGNWSAETPTCEAVTCDPLLMPENGHMSCTDPLGNSSFRSVCAMTCGEGYVLRGEKTLTCLKTGNWSAETPTCEARQCPFLTSPEKGWMNCSHPHALFSYGSQCSFGCEIGYLLKEESMLNCTSAGAWSQEIPSCKVVQCEPLLRSPLSQSDSNPVPLMNCSHPSGNFSFTSLCVFSCTEGYRLNGTAVQMCTSAGLWTDVVPTCIMEDMALVTGFLVYGAVGTASSVGLLLTGGLIILLVQQFKKDKTIADYSAWDGMLNPVFEQ